MEVIYDKLFFGFLLVFCIGSDGRTTLNEMDTQLYC